jgi:hypothetical protein
MPAKNDYIHVRTEKSMLEALDRQAAREKLTRSALILKILSEYLTAQHLRTPEQLQEEFDHIKAELQWQRDPVRQAELAKRRDEIQNLLDGNSGMMIAEDRGSFGKQPKKVAR